MSHRDYCEKMQENVAAHKADMEANDKSHREQSNPILSSAGETPSKRKALRKKNPENTALFDKTYQQMDDKQMRDNFHSEDKNVLAAMAIATKKTAEENNIAADNLDAINPELIEKSNFNAHYEKATQDIKDGVISPKHTEDFYSDKGLANLEEQQKDNNLTKSLQSKSKNNLVEKVVGCEKKTCQLDTFKISEVGKKTNIENWLNGEGRLSPSKRAGDKVNTILDKIFKEDKTEQSSGGSLIADLINGNTQDEIHLVAGNLTHFQRYFDIDVNGKCGHGLDETCPTIKITSDKTKYVEGLSDSRPYFDKSAKELKEFNLAPQPFADNSEKTTFKEALSLLKMDVLNKSQTYSFFLESCSDSGNHLYSDFTPAFVVHQPFILKSSMSFEWNQKKRTISPSLTLVARLDKDTYKCTLSAKDIQNGYTELLGDNIAKAVEYAGIVYGKLANLDKTDQLENEAETENNNEATTESENSGEFLPPCINVSYLMKRVEQPALNYSDTAMLHSVFISASPFIKYQKTINLKTVMWRASASYVARGALMTATSGLSEVAIVAANNTEIGENIANSFTNHYHLLKSHIVKIVKENKYYKSLTADAIEAGPEDADGNHNESDQGASIAECNEVSEEKVGSTFSCDLKVSAALETDDPSAGLVFIKRPGGKFYDFDLDSSTSTLYGGLNFTVDGKLSSDMNILKCVGLGNALVDVKEAGLSGKALSADKMGESRFGFTFRYLTKTRQNEEVTKKQNAASDPNIEYDQELIDAPTGLCYQVFYSGLSVYIEAFVTFTKSKVRGEENKSITEEDKTEPEQTSTPVRRGGRKDDDTDKKEFSQSGDKQKTLINLRIIPARESKYYKVKAPLKIGGTDNITTE